jgi:PAS domain S-box-containing protein
MTQDNHSQDKLYELRTQAEAVLPRKGFDVPDISALSTEEIQELVHELHVHQIELELQNVDLRQAQLKLEELKDKYMDLYDFAPAGYMTLNDKGLILEANLTAVRLLGVERTSLLKMFLSHFVCQEFVNPYYSYLKQVFESQSRETCEIKLTRKDGAVFYAQMESVAVQDETGGGGGGGPYNRCRTILTDMTEHNLADEQLSKSEEKYRLLADNMEDVIWQVTPDLMFTYISPSIKKQRGYDPSEILGRPIWEFITPDSIEPIKARVAERLELLRSDRVGFVPEPYVTEQIRKDGTTLWTETITTPVFNDEGQLIALQGVTRDITERNRVKDALALSEAQKTAILNGITTNIAFVNANLEMLWVNKAGAESVGKSQEEIIGATCHSLWADPERPCENCPTQKAFQTKKSEETIMTTPDGRVWNERGEPVFDDRGNLIGVVELAQDITELKRAEEALRGSEEKHRLLVENSYDIIYTLNTEGIFTFVSPAWTELLGHPIDQVIGQPFQPFVHVDDIPVCLEFLQKVLNTEQRQDGVVYRVKHINGEWRWHRTNAVPFKDEAGKVIGLQGIARDFTDRKLSEEALRESEQSSRLLIEQAPIGIGIMHDGVLVNVNPQLLEIFGYDSIHEVLGLPVEDFYSPEDRALITQRRKDRLSGKLLPMHYEVKGLKKNGESFDLEVWPTVVDYEGKPAILTFCADMSETKSLRSQLLQAQKMEAIGTLAGGVAHDFNNLLQVVLGYSEILLNDKHPEHQDYDKLHTINATAKRGSDLVQRLLVFSRKGDTKPRSLNLNHEVTQLKKLLERTIPKMIAIELSLESWLPVINADPVQVEQILLNLAINAKDAMPESGGKLTIETRNITLDEEYCRTHLESKPGQYVMISVSDTGHGMSQETVQHIFEPFFTTKGAGKGTGLGLAMVYGIMKHHEGFINCKSELGHGTTFRIYFPVVQMELEEDLEQESAVPQGGSETILLVDDEESLCDIGSQLLTRAGYTVLTATNARDALNLYRNQRSDISLVILDLIMPGMGGKECFQELVNINPQVKVILSSGFLSDGTTEEARVFGFRGLVEKPYNMRELLETVREVLDGD